VRRSHFSAILPHRGQQGAGLFDGGGFVEVITVEDQREGHAFIDLQSGGCPAWESSHARGRIPPRARVVVYSGPTRGRRGRWFESALRKRCRAEVHDGWSGFICATRILQTTVPPPRACHALAAAGRSGSPREGVRPGGRRGSVRRGNRWGRAKIGRRGKRCPTWWACWRGVSHRRSRIPPWGWSTDQTEFEVGLDLGLRRSRPAQRPRVAGTTPQGLTDLRRRAYLLYDGKTALQNVTEGEPPRRGFLRAGFVRVSSAGPLWKLKDLPDTRFQGPPKKKPGGGGVTRHTSVNRTTWHYMRGKKRTEE